MNCQRYRASSSPLLLQVFYYVHHIVFAMYALSIAHTFDDVNRVTHARSQVRVQSQAMLGCHHAPRPASIIPDDD